MTPAPGSIDHALPAANDDAPVILMYHRVARLGCDPWHLAVGPDNFERQLAHLRREHEIVPLNWLAQQLRAGRLPRRAVALTFDDGYADALEAALPALRRHEAPATFFIVTSWIGRSGFWWDVLARILLDTLPLPERLDLEIGNDRVICRLSDAPEGPPSPRPAEALTPQELHLRLWRLLKPLSEEERRHHLHALARWAGTDELDRDTDRPLTDSELIELARSPLVTLAPHTATHPSLPCLGAAERREEIVQSCSALEAISGRPPRGFSYPFGDVDAACPDAVRDAGLHYACTTVPGRLGTGSDPFLLPRLNVRNWDVDRFRTHLQL